MSERTSRTCLLSRHDSSQNIKIRLVGAGSGVHTFHVIVRDFLQHSHESSYYRSGTRRGGSRFACRISRSWPSGGNLAMRFSVDASRGD